ncbi:hypothetical protein ACIP98_39750 [Streptomyces sp. NPDC088354]|uniref:hypothetical protein n=1 Tax=Streptomyces sp. NPDC088354 TaxID=3365856 RepID=UPI00380EACD7
MTFTYSWSANPVDGAADDVLPLTKPRVHTITSETGAQTTVSYMEPDRLARQSKPALDANTRHCYPVYRSPNGGPDPQLDGFQKYPVSAVTTIDPAGGSEPATYTCTYSGCAWHYSDDPMTSEKERTWPIWRE